MNSISKMLAILAISAGIGSGTAVYRKLSWQPNKQKVEETQRRRGEVGERHDQIRKSAGISLEEFKAMIQRGAIVIDARSKEDFEKSHLRIDSEPPVLHLEPDKVDAAALNRLMNLSDRPFAIYCNSAECKLGEELYVELEKNGFSNMKIYVDGWEGITKAKLPVVSGPDVWGMDTPPPTENQEATTANGEEKP